MTVMPEMVGLLNADEARSGIIIKRSLKPGFAGVDNPLFYDAHGFWRR